MSSRVVSTPTYEYSHTIGIDLYDGRGFRDPVDLALGPDEKVYVLQRGTPYHRNVLIKICSIGEEFFGEFGSYGSDRGQWVSPACILMDSEERLYVSDEWNHRISVFDTQGNLLDEWSEPGDGDGQLCRPCGITLDAAGNLLVVDTCNHRIQKFTTHGRFLARWGGFGGSAAGSTCPGVWR